MTAFRFAGTDRRRWLVAAAGSLAMACGFGMITTVAAFMKPLEDEFGWLRADISGAYTLTTIGAAAGGLFWGALADRFDTRPIAVFGALVLGAGLLLLSRQSSLAAIQTIYLLMGAAGFACLYTPVLTAVGAWFDRGRGLAIGVVTGGGALGQGLMPTGLQLLLDESGWRAAYATVGVAYIFGLAPLMLLLRKPASGQGAGNVGRSGGWPLPPLVTVPLLALASVLCCVCMAVPLVHLLPHLIDAGRSPTSAATLMLIIMVTGTFGRVAFGAIADRIGGLRSYALASAIQAATVYLLVSVDAPNALYFVAVVFGFGFSGVMTTLIVCVREAAGPRSAGLATALVGMAAWLGMGGGGYLGGYCFDATRAYETSFAAAAAAGAANVVLLLGLWLALARPAFASRTARRPTVRTA